MTDRRIRAQDRDSLARFLGWFSVGLGVAQVTAPRAMSRLVGAGSGDVAAGVMRALGLRELTQGIGILTRPRPTGWLWSRVAGDALDLSLLGLAAARHRRSRTFVAIANVAAVAVPDAFESVHLARKRGAPARGRWIRKAVTINRPRREVEEAWTAAEELRRKVDAVGASVHFDEAPGNRGTELVVELLDDPRTGELARAARKLTGRDLLTRLSDDLRRFKQRIETGEVTRSDASPDGHLLAEHLRQRAAQPLEEARA